MQDIPKSKKGLTGGEILGLIIFIISIFIAYNDFVIVPKENKEYTKSCYVMNFMEENFKGKENSQSRQAFYDCYGEDLSLSLVKSCWAIYAPETLSRSYVMNECAQKQYEGMLFK